MAYTLMNLLSTCLAIDSIGKSLKAGASCEVNKLTSEIIACSQNSRLSVAMEAGDILATLTASADSQTEFDLLFDIPSGYSIVLVKDGRVLVEGTDYSIDNDNNLLTWLGDALTSGDNMYVTGTLTSGSTIQPLSISSDKLDQATQSQLKHVQFDEPVDVDATHKTSKIQITDVDGTELSEEVVLKLTVGGDATLALKSGGNGTEISGTGTAALVVKTHTDGTFDIEVTDATAEAVTVEAGVTQGSAILDCSITQDFDFSA